MNSFAMDAAMDAPQVPISLVIAKMHDMVSARTPQSQELKDQVRFAINDLQSVVMPKSIDHQQEPPAPTAKLSLLMSARDAENTIDRILTEVSRPPRTTKGLAGTVSFCCSLPRRTLRRGNDDIVQELIKHVKNLSDLARAQAQCVSVDPDAGRAIAAPPSLSLTGQPPQERNKNDESDIVGRESLVSNIMAQLINGKDKNDSNLRVISVLGDEAIGKTALARIVYGSTVVRNYFDCCAWIHVPEEPKAEDLMVDLLKQVTVRELRDVELMKEQQLSDALQSILQECRYLVVLDNLHDCDIMDRLMLVLADSRNGSRVIITTRDADIPLQIDPWYSKHLDLVPLNREQSRELLGKCCAEEISTDVHPTTGAEASDLTEKILGKCGGSPARILLLGGLISVTERSGSAALLDKVQDSPPLEDIVSLSYRKLPYWLKPCALYLALFPKESEISTRRLFRLWLAEGMLFSSSDSRASIDLAENCFGELVSRNLVHVVRRKWDGSARTCRLPRMLYDFFSQMAKESGYFQICGSSVLERFRNENKVIAPRIAICKDIGSEEAGKQKGPQRSTSNNDVSTSCSIGQLLSYVSFNTIKLGTHSREVESLFTPLLAEKDPILLRVLDLEGVYKPVLPDQLGKIVLNLRYLGLRWTVLESLPKSVWQLPHLEILDMKYTKITQVPSSIWEAQNLQHLYMNDVCFDDCIPQKMGPQRSLNHDIRTVSGLFIGAKSPMLNVLGELTGLRKLALTCHPTVVKDATKHISKLKLLESLRLRSRDQLGQPSVLKLCDLTMLESLSKLYLVGALRRQGLSSIPLNLTVLTLSMSELKDDPMEVLGMLKNLTTLRLFAGAYSGKVFVCREQAFPRLCILKLWKLEELKSWTIEGNAMPCLKELEIKECQKLQEIVGLQQIETLKEVVMVKVKEVLARGIEAWCSKLRIPLIRKDLIKNEAGGDSLDDGNNEDEDEDGDSGLESLNDSEEEENGEDEEHGSCCCSIWDDRVRLS